MVPVLLQEEPRVPPAPVLPHCHPNSDVHPGRTSRVVSILGCRRCDTRSRVDVRPGRQTVAAA